MSLIDPGWNAWYRGEHDRMCRKSGSEFEAYVANVLKRFHDNGFVNPEPMGRLGDKGCDGITALGDVAYACYGRASDRYVDQVVSKKMCEDFDKALINWSSFTVWRFITNSGFGPTSTQSLINLQQEHAPASIRPVKIEVWKDSDDLWSNAVSKLSVDSLMEILPGVPHYNSVEFSDLAELIIAMENVIIEPCGSVERISPVLLTKMDFNRISEKTKAEFNEGRLLSSRIEKWFSEHAVPSLRDEKAASFREAYSRACKETQDSQEIVERVYVMLGGNNFRYSASRANAVYAITVYFFDSCDIFEDPRDGSQEGVQFGCFYPQRESTLNDHC